MGKVKRCGLFAETLRYAGGVPQLRFRLPMGYAICCSDDGRKLACLGRRVNVFDISSRQKISTTHPFPHPSHAAFSPDGKILVVKFTSGRIVVLDPATGNMMHDHKNQREGEGSEVLSSPDGHDLIDASWDGVIKVRKSFERTVVTQQQFEGEMIKRISHDSVRRTWLIEHRPKLRLGENWPRSPYLTLPEVAHRETQTQGPYPGSRYHWVGDPVTGRFSRLLRVHSPSLGALGANCPSVRWQCPRNQ
jgi:hypothetical protein